MADVIREAPLGQIIRWVTRNKFLKYPEEEADFQCPRCYRDPESADSLSVIEEKNSEVESADPAGRKEVGHPEPNEQKSLPPAKDINHHRDVGNLHTHKTNVSVGSSIDHEHDLEKLYTQKTHTTITSGIGAQPALTRTKTREMTRAFTRERFDIEQEEQSLKELNMPIIAQRNEGGDILVDWYTTDDQANPQNWSSKKKAFVGSQILCVSGRRRLLWEP